MLKQLFINASESEDFYEDEFLNFYDGPDSKARMYFNHNLEEFLNRLEKIEEIPEGIKVWRAIRVLDLKDLNLDIIGGSWSYRQSAAHAWYGGAGYTFILEGYINFESIDIITTLRQNLVNPDEEEFRLLSNVPVFITSILQKDNTVLRTFSPAKQSSSGKISSIGSWQK